MAENVLQIDHSHFIVYVSSVNAKFLYGKAMEK
jgi:hypothetical protein